MRASLEAALCPSLNGLTNAHNVAIARAALRKPLGEVALDSPTSSKVSAVSVSTTEDSTPGTARSIVTDYGVKRASVRSIVNTICSGLPLNVEAQLTLELALCSAVGPCISGTRGEVVGLKASNEHLQLKVG